MLKHSRRILSGLLSLAMVGSLCAAGIPPAAAAEHHTQVAQTAAATGSIALTLSFDLPQRVAEVKNRSIKLALTGGGKNITVSLADGTASGADGLSVSVKALNIHGVEQTTEDWIGAYEAVVAGLPTGTYTMTVSGRGYATCSTQVKLEDYSQHVLMGTADGTFSLGDVTGDGLVNNADRAEITEHLGTTDTSARNTCDLSGDGVVDVVDLSYVNKNMNLTAQPRILDTAAIVKPEVDTSMVTVSEDSEGSLEDLFTGEKIVTLAPAPNQSELSIPISLEKPTEMSEISISSPSTTGAVQAGAALVEYEEDGHLKTMNVPFDASVPNGVHAIGRNAGQSVVTIDLGKKVAVKKVTITVTKVEGQAGKPEFATVTQIEFIKDIVSEETKADTQVKGLAATVGDGTVSLAWDSMNNVSGYVVKYSTTQAGLTQPACPSVSVTRNKAAIADLENGTTYYFQVTAVNGDWSGTPSAILSAAPLAASVPGAPTNLVIEPADGALRLSWSKTKDATFYQVFYRVSGASDWTQWGSDLSATSAVITGLTNGTEYEAAVKAGNIRGTGPLSAIALGTPEKEGFDMPELPVDGRIDNTEVASIVMADKNNVNWQLSPNFKVDHLIDNDPNTYWVAKDWWYNSNITYTLSEPHDMNYLIVVPYLAVPHKNVIKTYSLEIKDANDKVLLKGSYPAPRINEEGYIVLTFPEVKGAKSVTLGLAEVEGGGARVSISEIAFYESNTLASDIAALFTDGTFTALNSSVQKEHITALREQLNALSSFYFDLNRLKDELNLAEMLLNGEENALGLLKHDFQSRSTSAAADQAAGQSASDLQPLGITAKAWATVAIYAQLPGDAPVYVVPTQFYGESGVWKGDPVELKNGRNYITVPKIGSLSDTRGGPLYLTYTGSNSEDIQLQVRVLSDAWQMPVLELSGWYDMNESQRKNVIQTYVQALEAYVSTLPTSGLTTDVRNATEISTPSILLSLPADQVLAGLRGVNNDNLVQTMYNNVLAWEEELFVANKVQGVLDSNTSLSGYQYPMTTRQNIRYMRMFPGAFMYAAGNHIGVEYGSTAALVQGKPTSVTGAGHANGLFGWGIAHEIGHNMDKLGRAECTNNLYSLALQAWDGGSMALDTRLTTDERWAQIFDKVAQARPGAANNVFVQLGMYWQLHLAYDEAAEPLAFYNAFFKAWKSGAYNSGYSYDERVALVASQVANRNLTEFFTRWGMTLGDDVKAILDDYQPEPRAIWYLNDDARNYRLSSGTAASGSASVTADVNEAKVTLTIEHPNADKVLGYEIRRNGKVIGFATESTYVDDLGAANNLTYTYSVVPVDKLGNRGSEAKADELRVAYDKTIDPSLYDLKWAEDGTITITMKNGAVPVTGLKVTGTGLSGGYTVRVKADTTQAWTTAKTGALSDHLVAYFTKPGAEPADTRIWTYDAAVVEITGIPEGAAVELLDYPGDRVDFYQGAAVGILKDDYQYGDGADEVIEAGTLVILGTYRGDPRFNYVEIQARYSTAPEAGEVTYIQRPMNGYGLLLAEIPADGAVSDTSDGFFLFVPDLEAEKDLNAQDGVTDDYPLEIRANFYRTDDAASADGKRLTSQTLWISFPEEDSLPLLDLNSGLSEQKG